ncbi:hypothetical protein IMZ48_25415 [Candidatus Bathyarchaeota archaeon]|nr:hypothetical protein [Candidatus Bathyarchaeota archaeon]
MASPISEKKAGSAASDLDLGAGNKEGKGARVDAIAGAPEVTLASFAHLDEKKILRKVSVPPIVSVVCWPGSNEKLRWTCV